MNTPVFVYSFTFIDNYTGLLERGWLVENDWGPPPLSDLREIFRTAGWEEDGEIRFIWLPPFCFPPELALFEGVLVAHVKQKNNGVSWLASQESLDYLPGFQQANSSGCYHGRFSLQRGERGQVTVTIERGTTLGGKRIR